MSNVLKCVATHTNKPRRTQANWTCISLARQLALEVASSTTNYPSSDWRLLCSTGSMIISRFQTSGKVSKKSSQMPSNSFQYISGSKLWAAISTLVSSLPRNNKRVLVEAGSGKERGHRSRVLLTKAEGLSRLIYVAQSVHLDPKLGISVDQLLFFYGSVQYSILENLL